MNNIKILDMLKDNARLSYTDLGRKINLSPSSVRERIQKMEVSGVIKKYTIQSDHKKPGYGLEALLLLKVFPGQFKDVLTRIKDFPDISEAHRISGNQNLHVKVVLRYQIELQNLLDKHMSFGDTNTFLILSEV